MNSYDKIDALSKINNIDIERDLNSDIKLTNTYRLILELYYTLSRKLSFNRPPGR